MHCTGTWEGRSTKQSRSSSPPISHPCHFPVTADVLPLQEFSFFENAQFQGKHSVVTNMGDFPERTSMNSRYRGLTQAASSELERPLLRALDELSKSLKSEREEHYRYVFSSLTQAMQTKDAELYRHSWRVQQYAYQLARTLDLSEGELETIQLAAFFHDIGKIGIHDLVLNKPASLTPLEYEYVKEHATRGALILTHSRVLRHLAPLVRTHHEQWDGSGYPFGLRGEAIPLGARIISIADAFEAMTANRVYQAARTPFQALKELVRCAGTHFDPLLVERFCASMLQRIASDERRPGTCHAERSEASEVTNASIWPMLMPGCASMARPWPSSMEERCSVHKSAYVSAS